MSLENLLYHLVDLFYKDKIIVAFVKDIKGKRLHLLFPTGREELVSAQALVSIGKQKFNPDNLIFLQNLLKEKQAKREKLKERFDLRELWEVVTEEVEKGLAWDLVELYLARTPDCDEVAAFMRKALEDKLYFALEAPDILKIRKRDEVKVLQLQREKEYERLKLLNEGEMFLLALINGKQSLLSKDREYFWQNVFKEFVLKEGTTEEGRLAEEVLKKHQLNDPLKIVDLLSRACLIEEDWFFELEKLSYPAEFKKEELEEAEKLKTFQVTSSLKDLTDLFTFTIDAPETEDFDDALSVEERGEILVLYVHIAEVAYYIRPGSSLWAGALERASTLYLPEGVLPMLPFPLSHEKFSLKRREIKPALTFKFEIDSAKQVCSFEIIPSLIQVKERYTYAEVDNLILKGDPFFRRLYTLLIKHKEARYAKGAFAVILPEIQVRVFPNGEINVQKIEMTPSRDLVAEAMILTNYYSAKFMAERGIPVLYRTQKEPFQAIEDRLDSLYHQILQLKFMAKSELSIEPGYHSGLGLPCYTTLTSPIRRFLDLLVQYQLEAYLSGATYLSKEDLLKILPDLQSNLQRANYLQNRRKKYFLLKYLQRYRSQDNLRGILLEVQARKAKVYLPDYNLTGEVLSLKNNLHAGMEVIVKPEKINPLQEVLRLRIV